MPEYLAPGVYVEETSFRSKSIEGVSTTTTGFVGPTRFGPLSIQPDVVTSLADFELIYGDGQPLGINGGTTNFMWHAVRAFFTEGGRRLYIARVANGAVAASANVPAAGGASALTVSARFPGSGGNQLVRFTFRLGANALSLIGTTKQIAGLAHNDLVWIGDTTSPGAASNSDPGAGRIYLATLAGSTWTFTPTGPATALALTDAVLDPAGGYQIRPVTVTVTVFDPNDPNRAPRVWENLPLHPGHQRSGVADSLFDKFAATPDTLALARSLPLVIGRGASVANGRDVFAAFVAAKADLLTQLTDLNSSDAARTFDVALTTGTDGAALIGGDYDGTRVNGAAAGALKGGLRLLEDIEDIAIVAAPGSTFNYGANAANADAITGALIAHASKMRYRIAVLDSGNGMSPGDARAQRGKFDSTYAAYYYPWVTTLDPYTGKELNLPPSGFVSGIYARNDIVRAVYKAPANEPVNLAVGFERLVNRAEQEVLNPEGVNCFRFFEGRGFRLWGARTISSDPEWKYVNLRRYFAYLERSIDKGTQWAVFEPNGEALWANVRRTVEDFLLNEWTNGALLGDKPEKAFFVRCDRSTMTQNDLDNGRLVCLIGVAPLRPAEFVIFRIGQWTGDRRA